MNIREHLEFARVEWDRKVIATSADRAAWDTDIDDEDAGRARCIGPLLRRIRLRPHWRVLDIGCGGARLLEDVAGHVPYGEVVGYDVSRKMLRIAIRRMMNVRASSVFVLGDGLTIPTDKIAPASVDFTFSVLTFQHNPPQVWRSLLVDALQLARPGGLLRIQLRDNPEDSGLPLSFPITSRAAVKVVENAGWKVLSVTPGWRWVGWYWITARAPRKDEAA